MAENESINLFKFLLGILLIFGMAIYLIYTIRSARKDKNYDHMTYSYDVNIVVGAAIFLVIGIILVYRELSKVGTISLMILTPFIGLSQQNHDLDCTDLNTGVFETYEDGVKTGIFYRMNDRQIEMVANEKTQTKSLVSKLKSCEYYIMSKHVSDLLDTITMSVKYEKLSDGIYSFIAKPAFIDVDYIYTGKIKKIDETISKEILEAFKEW